GREPVAEQLVVQAPRVVGPEVADVALVSPAGDRTAARRRVVPGTAELPVADVARIAAGAGRRTGRAGGLARGARGDTRIAVGPTTHRIAAREEPLETRALRGGARAAAG